ncbi:RNA polymerase sigma factor [Haloimpatiens sp. FM7315]|uniref:RNA polymerase sigma factor n=1 Tax=Haloimpatiens sp. FM7315 TaxID=3298609 RepID=UPI00370B80FA
MEDSEIIDLYLNRNEDAINETNMKYGRQIYSIALNILQNSSDAEECENDTYMKSWNSIPPHNPKNYLFAFLARITRHLSLDFCKYKNRQKRKAVLVEFSKELEDCLPAPDNQLPQFSDTKFGELISTFLRKIDDDKRNVFIRRYWFFDSIKMIAERFQMSDSKVKSMLFHTRKKLKKYLEKEGVVL